MTRTTNFARKRTYVEAGFLEDRPADQVNLAAEESASNPAEIATTNEVGIPSENKKRNKSAKSGNSYSLIATPAATGDGKGAEPWSSPDSLDAVANTQSRTNKEKRKDASYRAKTTELRREKRIAQKKAKTVCFACRQTGHAAAECPIIRHTSNVGSPNKSIVGICYRCGSTRHTLSRCKKAADPADLLPFASCFVCSGKGHLASLCPQNKTKGIYPNGGSCKLCGDNTHLARHCKLRKDESNQQIPLGIGSGDDQHGADEDDFHVFKRRKAEIEKDEKNEDKIRRIGDVKVGAHSGIMKAFGKPDFRSTKKVVTF